jgi:hypothetical protein
MTKAKRVHSTPRKTASKSKRANTPKSTGSADAERARLYGSLENPVCECARMAEIAMDAQAAQADYRHFRGRQALRHGAFASGILLRPSRDADHGKELTP